MKGRQLPMCLRRLLRPGVCTQWRRSSTVIEGEVFGARLSESLTPNFANFLLLVNENLPSFSELVFSANCALGLRTGHIGSNTG